MSRYNAHTDCSVWGRAGGKSGKARSKAAPLAAAGKAAAAQAPQLVASHGTSALDNATAVDWLRLRLPEAVQLQQVQPQHQRAAEEAVSAHAQDISRQPGEMHAAGDEGVAAQDSAADEEVVPVGLQNLSQPQEGIAELQEMAVAEDAGTKAGDEAAADDAPGMQQAAAPADEAPVAAKAGKDDKEMHSNAALVAGAAAVKPHDDDLLAEQESLSTTPGSSEDVLRAAAPGAINVMGAEEDPKAAACEAQATEETALHAEPAALDSPPHVAEAASVIVPPTETAPAAEGSPCQPSAAEVRDEPGTAGALKGVVAEESIRDRAEMGQPEEEKAAAKRSQENQQEMAALRAEVRPPITFSGSFCPCRLRIMHSKHHLRINLPCAK